MSMIVRESEIDHDEIYAKVSPSDRVAAMDHLDAALTVLHVLKGKNGVGSNEAYRAVLMAYKAVECAEECA